MASFQEQKSGGYHSKEIMSKETEKILNWLRKNKSRLSITGIAKEVGISTTQLHKAIDEGVDGRGYVAKIPEKHLPKLTEVIKDMKF